MFFRGRSLVRRRGQDHCPQRIGDLARCAYRLAMCVGRAGSELGFAQHGVAQHRPLRPTAGGASDLREPRLDDHLIARHSRDPEAYVELGDDDLPALRRHVLQRHTGCFERFSPTCLEPCDVHRMVDVVVRIELTEADPKRRAMNHRTDRTNLTRNGRFRRPTPIGRLAVGFAVAGLTLAVTAPVSDARTRRQARVMKRLATTVDVELARDSAAATPSASVTEPPLRLPVPAASATPAATIPDRAAAPLAPVIPTATPTTTVPATTAPTTTTAPTPGGATLGGCPVFPPDNPWNQDVRALALSPQSSTWLRSLNGAGVRYVHPDFGSNPDYGIPFTIVPASQPGVAVTFDDYGDESDPGPYPIPTNAPIEAGGDRHVLALQQGTCRLFELYNARPSTGRWTASSGAIFDLRSNALRPKGWTSADAAGLPILPGLARFDEVRSGQVTHALRVTVPATQRGFISPARHAAGTVDASLPPMGARLRLRADFDLRAYHGDSLVILTALQRYGMIVADNGSAWFISGATDPRWNDNDLEQLKGVPGTAFEFVDTGAVEAG